VVLLQKNRPLIEEMLPHIFWLVRVKIHWPGAAGAVDSLVEAVGRLWGNFLFPFETDTSMDWRLRDVFVESVPYFLTQACQRLFVLISHGLAETTNRAFRRGINGTIVEVFTRIRPLDSLLQAHNASHIARPPQVDIVAPLAVWRREEPRALPPIEDLRSLCEMPRRKRPRRTTWAIAGISTLVGASTHRKQVPFEHNSEMVVQYPRDGEADWTTKLPPPPTRAPDRVQPHIRELRSGGRSTLYRFRRRNLCSEYLTMKREFARREHECRPSH